VFAVEIFFSNSSIGINIVTCFFLYYITVVLPFAVELESI